VTTDDIVTRLRTTLAHADDVYDTMNQAADEIEYLRSEMGNLNSEYNKLWRKYEQALKDNSTLIYVCQDPERKWMCGE
jgi:uncharacterized coiled-coil DUF342 family protein